MSFEFNVEQPQNYDIWVLANLPGCHQASQMKFSLNNSEQETIWKSMPSSGCFPYNGPSDGTIDGGLNHLESVMKNKVYSAPALGTQFPLCWYKLSGSQYLSEGKNNAEISVVKASEHFVAFVDCVAAVPSSMNWIPGGNIEYP